MPNVAALVASSVVLGALLVAQSSELVSPGGAQAASVVLSRTELHAQQLRRQFGFVSDPESVRRVERDPSSSTGDLGVPLTPREHRELQRRDELGARIAAVDAAFGRSVTYGGSWLDQASGGILRIAFTLPADPGTRGRIADLTAGSKTVTVEVVAYSVSALQEVYSRVARQSLADLQARRGIQIGSTGVDLATNRVMIAIPPDAPIGRQAELMARFGPAVRIERRPIARAL